MLAAAKIAKQFQRHLVVENLVVSLTCVIGTYNTMTQNFGIIYKFTKHKNETCGFGSEQHVTFKYFLKNAKIFPTLRGCFRIMCWLTHLVIYD